MPPKNLLLLDFDGTITAHDTIASLITLCINPPNWPADNSPQKPSPLSATRSGYQDRLLMIWSDVLEFYNSEHRIHADSYTPAAADRTTLELELTWLESLREVEAGSDGIVLLRKGFSGFLERMTGREDWDVAVVSVNWSSEFIRGVLEEGSGCAEKVEKVVANDIVFPPGEVKGPEELGKAPLVVASDKLRAMKSLKEGLHEQRVVYFGDSPTDLACQISLGEGF
ncbi:hypothetical protein N0V88_006636 [Collariella sp. IMI 366227]|nr:hypothetical protein N0V88_006636 [Collariella sp. IMI 366227]